MHHSQQLLTNVPQLDCRFYRHTTKRNTSIPFTDLATLANSLGLDSTKLMPEGHTAIFKKAVRDLAPKGAKTKRQNTIGALTDDISDSGNEVKLQISRRVPSGDGVDYDKLVVVTINKANWHIDCADPVVLKQVQDKFNAAVGSMRTDAIGRSIVRWIEPELNTTIFGTGSRSAYLVLEKAFPLIDKIVQFVNAIGWSSNCIEFTAGVPAQQNNTQQPPNHNTQQVQSIVIDSLRQTIDDILDKRVLTVNSESRRDKVENVQRELQDLEDKINYAAQLVGDGRAILEDQLAYVRKLLEDRETLTPEEDERQKQLAKQAQQDMNNSVIDDEEVIPGSVPPPMFPTDDDFEVVVGDASSLNHVNSPFVGPK